MSNLVEIRAVVRSEKLDPVIRQLKECGLARITVTRVHAVGVAVAAQETHMDVREGAYRDMALVQCICDADRCDMTSELLAAAARTGQSGDGIVSVHPVLEVIKIRTGAVGLAALR